MEDEERNEEMGEHRGRGDRGERHGMKIRPNYFMPKPVKVGDVITAKIEDMAQRGDGIARVDGFVVFVKGAKQGDELKIKITEVKARFAIGEPVS